MTPIAARARCVDRAYMVAVDERRRQATSVVAMRLALSITIHRYGRIFHYDAIDGTEINPWARLTGMYVR